MKRILILCVLIIFCLSVSCYASSSTILINGQEAIISPEMGSVKNISDRTFVPVRFVLEYLNFRVTWDDTEKVVMGRNSLGSVFIMQVDNNVFSYKDEKGDFEVIEMDVAPILFSDEQRTYIPIRFLAQAIGYKVGYDELSATVTLDK